MVSLQVVCKNNTKLKKLGPGLVGVFGAYRSRDLRSSDKNRYQRKSIVGGTAGIGETTVREFVRYTLQPIVYLVGHKEEQATKIIGELRNINGDAKIYFIKSNISLLRNVDKTCERIQAKEEKINLLFMSEAERARW